MNFVSWHAKGIVNVAREALSLLAENLNVSFHSRAFFCHSRASGNPYCRLRNILFWMPAKNVRA
jgi:hypothetical protein